MAKLNESSMRALKLEARILWERYNNLDSEDKAELKAFVESLIGKEFKGEYYGKN